mmetsp:Transcript_29881/g.50865  ORF Transcript_29881/g.50865 Transcript_29881/m.50865 type:complete len:687 (-) Transcript_29881:112-2172(-)|eukprot:CAMPEP_0183710764 /NCGR_PEP_ID=MMETSP0737-20130205/6413_1 /TAXON_ID=385413 /ORGANISM="Thalassiosira miniscula, Strain CCMP1093" /LENGTH=686 /DNA_ID=CAMNT_0025939099 /DNA_START=90 /DNA_END=2150 /DNA_ORIENTATION=-
MAHPPELRGIFGEKGDSQNWLDAISQFPNGVPRFQSKDECVSFMTEYNTHHGGSNPEQPHLMHIFTMLTNWEQIERILLPGIAKARAEPSFAKPVPRDYLVTEPSDNTSQNVYEQKDSWNVIHDINYRLNLPIHRCTTPASTTHTLKYLFYHMKCGIFVMIRDGKLRIFAPFVNSDYRNTWGDKLTLEGDGSLNTYYSAKSGLYRDEDIEPDKTKWWANGNIICNELSKPEERDKTQFWGDHFLAALRDMIGEACRQRSMPDCEFFLNKRDYPQLKVNIPRGGEPVEPYGFIFDKDDRVPEEDVDLFEGHKFESYAPIVSFYAASPQRFSDVPWPSSEDWEAACGEVFPGSFMHSKDKDGNAVFAGKPRDLFTEGNFRKFERSWDDGRVATAFFRGTATGGGTTIHNNQRLMVAHLGHIWKDDPEKGGDEPFVDAAIVGWNMRDKKTADSPMTFLRPTNFGFDAGKHHFTPIYEQSKYKYLIYVDGHCAACRYGFMMRLGSVILKVAPRQVADTMWYFPLLKPYVDHVPVKADLSDLEEKIRWCRQNDDKCREIGENAKVFYEKYVARNALLDYVEMACKQISKRFVKPPDWWTPPTAEGPPPSLRKPDVKCFEDRESGNSRYCVRCQEEVGEEERLKEEERRKEKEEKKDVVGRRQKLRERQKRKAAEERKRKAEAAAKRQKMKK